MLDIGVQTKNIVSDENPGQGYALLKDAGFACVDFSLNGYLTNRDLYEGEKNSFFDQSIQELEIYFGPHKKTMVEQGIRVQQMHMPYPVYVWGGKKELNDYLRNEVAVKSMEVCRFLDCSYMVVHGIKLAKVLGSEQAEWEKTESFLDMLAPMAKEMGITLCVENLYNSWGGRITEGPCCDARKAVERIDRFNEKHHAEILGFCFDTGHANLIGIDMEAFITTLGSCLKVLHIHDNDGVADLHQIPYTFTKTRENKPSTDWDGFVRGLRNVKYEGVLSFETAPVLSSFPKEMKEDTLRFIARIGQHFACEIAK